MDPEKDNREKDISLSRAVGQFLGHLWGATTRPVPEDETSTERVEVNRETREAEGEVDGKKVVLRRTTIEEVEFKEDD